MNLKLRWYLLAIVSLGFLLRVVWLDRYPAGFNPDEASFGYNAYSLLQTGRDEWGEPWYKLISNNLRAFGDDKFPAYVFLSVPSVKLFGLNEFATRLPNAVLGTLAILSVYLLTSRLFPKSKLWTALLMAISPWHISLSRGTFETNALTLFIPLGLYLILQGRFILAAIILGLNSYTYLAARFLSLPMAAITMWLARVAKPNWVKFGLVFLLIAGPGLWHMVTSGNNRVADVGIFNPTGGWQEVADRRFTARNLGLSDGLARIFNNKAVYLATTTVKNYLSYISWQFLFTQGAGEADYGVIPGRGLLYFFEIPLLLIFLWTFIKRQTKPALLLTLLILIAPIPATLAKGPGLAANRAAAMIPFLAIGSSWGLAVLDSRGWSRLLLGSVIIMSLLFFLENYIYHAPLLFGAARNSGIKEVFVRTKQLTDKYADVRFSRSLSEPHVYVAFYWQIDPKIYQQATTGWTNFDKRYKFLDQMDGYTLGKYRFGDIHPTDKTDHPILYIGRPTDFPPDFPEYFHIDYPNGQTAIKVAEKLP